MSRFKQTLIILSFALALFGFGHHWFVSQTFWSWSQFLHHENLIAVVLAFGIGILIGHWRRYER